MKEGGGVRYFLNPSSLLLCPWWGDTPSKYTEKVLTGPSRSWELKAQAIGEKKPETNLGFNEIWTCVSLILVGQEILVE